MSTLERVERKLTAADAVLLRRLGALQYNAMLDELLDEAEVVRTDSAGPADWVTLHAQVEIERRGDRRRQQLVLCEPETAVPAAGRISVLSPLGLALIGLPAGALARWCGPTGDAYTAEVRSVVQAE